MSLRDYQQLTATGRWFNTSTLTFSTLTYSQGDVIIVALNISPSTFERSRFGERRYDFFPPDGWGFLGDAEHGQPHSPFHSYVFFKIAKDNEELTFQITQNNQLLSLSDDDVVTLTGVAVSYSDVDLERPINSHYMTSDLITPLDLTVVRPQCHALLFSFVSQGTLTHTDYNQVVNAGHIRFENGVFETRGFAGNPNFTADNTLASRCLIALSNSVGGVEDPKPESGTGRGIIYPEAAITNPLTLKSYKLTSDNELELTDDFVDCISASLIFDGLGNCQGGYIALATSFSAGGLTVEPYSRFYELYLNSIEYTEGITVATQPILWYSGLLGGFAQRHTGMGFFQIPLISSYDLIAEGAMLGRTSPLKPPFIIDAKNYYDGNGVDIVPNTVDDFQTWSSYFNKKYSGITNAHYGVGADRRFTRGTPRSANYATLDASLHFPEPTESGKNNYVTTYYVEPTDTNQPVTLWDTRQDFGSNIPEKVAAVKQQGNAEAEVPPGFTYPIFEPQAYEFYYQGILIPPILCINLPNGRQQFASAVEVLIDINGQNVRTRVRTENLIVRS